MMYLIEINFYKKNLKVGILIFILEKTFLDQILIANGRCGIWGLFGSKFMWQNPK